MSPTPSSGVVTDPAVENAGRREAEKQEVARVHKFRSLKLMKAIMEDEASRLGAVGRTLDPERREGDDLRVAFICVPPKTIDKLRMTDDGTQLASFDKRASIVTFKMIGMLHGIATTCMGELLENIFDEVQMGGCFIKVCNVTEPPNEKASRGKAPDVAFYMRPQYSQGYDLKPWPQVVIEVGTSESQPKLEEDARFWLIDGGTAVRWVLTLKFFKDRALLCSWILTDTNKLQVRSCMEAVKHDGRYTLTSPQEDLHLSFSKLFLRQPHGHEPDTVVLSCQAFLDMVNLVHTQYEESEESPTQPAARPSPSRP